MDKEKQICETVGDVLNKIGYYKKRFKHTEEINALIRLINKLSNENIELKKKLPKDSVVLSREGLNDIENKCFDNGFDKGAEIGRANVRKETAEKFKALLEGTVPQGLLDEIAKEITEGKV